jgi:hypothetical protein
MFNPQTTASQKFVDDVENVILWPTLIRKANIRDLSIVGGPFAKFVGSPYYSESELRGGAVTVSFSKYLPWKAIHFLHRSTHFSKTCGASKFLASELPFHSWKRPEIAWGEIRHTVYCMADALMGFHRATFSKPNTEFNSDLAPWDFWAFPTMKRGLRGKAFRSDQRSAACVREVGGAL